ncbi:Uncharacterised protein [Mycobacteroides abscessus subsp. abscessus]|nr:Uncharacterised protein [Mycobacteroides abscessus subsp. abscessus]
MPVPFPLQWLSASILCALSSGLAMLSSDAISSLAG